MSKELAIGHFLTLIPNNSSSGRFFFQNFFIGEDVQHDGNTHTFLPFGFSGVSISRTGDNIDASLVFPNTTLSRPWGTVGIRNAWVARVQTLQLNPDNKTAAHTVLYDYSGQVAEGGWDNTTLTMTLNSVIDAVSSTVPHRVLEQSTVGYIPTTTSIRV